MGLGKYLAAGLLAGAAFLYSPSLHAQDVQQKVTFNDSAAQARKTPGRNLEGRLSVSASRDKSKLVLEISAEGCEIRTGFSEFYIGLPAESEIAELKQTAKIKESTQDGKGEEKWIDLYTVNELVEKGIFKAADYVADKVSVPVLTELLTDKVEKTKAARIQEWYKQMKKKGLFMEELSPDYPKIPSAHLTSLARRYEITLDIEPTKVPEARMQVCLQDQYERNITINDISVKFDGKSQMQQVQQTAKPNVPAGLEKFLLDDPEIIFEKIYGPDEIKKMGFGEFDEKDCYILLYNCQATPVNIRIGIAIANKKEVEMYAEHMWKVRLKDAERYGESVYGSKDNIIKNYARRMIEQCPKEEFRDILQRTGGGVSISLDTADYIIEYFGYIPVETLNPWTYLNETDTNKREANEKIVTNFKNKILRLRDSLKQKGEIKKDNTEKYFKDFGKALPIGPLPIH